MTKIKFSLGHPWATSPNLGFLPECLLTISVLTLVATVSPLGQLNVSVCVRVGACVRVYADENAGFRNIMYVYLHVYTTVKYVYI